MKSVNAQKEIAQKLQEFEKNMELYMDSVGMPIQKEAVPRKELSREDAAHLILTVMNSRAEIDKSWDTIMDVLGASWDSPIGNAIYRALDALIRYTEIILEDRNETLLWFFWENDAGKKQLHHEMPDGTMREVKGVEDLLDVMGF